MERYFILDKFNTFYDWDLIVIAKDITPPEPKTNLVELDGMSGTLDLSESLTGEITYKDRIITATFWTSTGNRETRERLLRTIIKSLHGRKIKIVEPDDPTHYFYGRVKITSSKNNLAYMEFSIEATCEPWRYAIEETERYIAVNSDVDTNLVIHNHGVKSICPIMNVTGRIKLTYGDSSVVIIEVGAYEMPSLILRQGVNIVGVSGAGAITFKYREAEL